MSRPRPRGTFAGVPKQPRSILFVRIAAAFIAVFALLVAILLPRLSRIRECGRPKNCASILRQIGLAIKQYAADYNDAFPPSFDELYPGYVDTAKIFSCPKKPSGWPDIRVTGKVTPESTSYVYISGLNDKDKHICILAYCRPRNHQQFEGSNVLFLDTHVEWMTTESGKLEHYLAETIKHVKAEGRGIRLLYGTAPPAPPPARWPYYVAGALAAALVLILALVLRSRRRRVRA